MTMLGQLPGAYLYAEVPTRYQLGDPSAPLLTLNAVDANGVLWWADEPEGWRATTAVTPLDRKQFGHGAFPGDTYLEERILSFTGSAVAPDAATAAAAADALVAAVQSNLTGDVQYTHLDESPPKSVFVRPANDRPKVKFNDPRQFDFQFQLVAANPFKLGASATYGPARLPSSSGGPGRSYPRTYPMHYGAPGSTPPVVGVQVPNGGDFAADAVYVVTGPVPNPQIHLGTGEYIAFGLTLAGAVGSTPADQLTVNTATGTATVNGTNRLDVLLTGSTFPLIPVGGTEVRLGSLSGGTDQAASLTVTTAPTWK